MSLAYPELPQAARPNWSPWSGPAAMFSALGALFFLLPAVPIILVGFGSETLEALSLLVLIVIQDAALVGTALIFAARKLPPVPWHFGLRPTRWRSTAAIALLAFLVMFGIEVGWFELLDVDESGDEELETGNLVAAFMVAIAVIVVAPVTEEFFFRGFFYRALRTKLRVWSAALIDGVVFASIHLQYWIQPLILPVIALFGIAMCLVYERTGSLFACIAIHAAFNTVASLGLSPVPAIVVGLLMLVACSLVPRRLPAAPSPTAL
jgi:membrane protease YdiL (CAAX protease family)